MKEPLVQAFNAFDRDQAAQYLRNRTLTPSLVQQLFTLLLRLRDHTSAQLLIDSVSVEQICAVNQKGQTLLHLAVEENDETFIPMLLAAGVPSDVPDRSAKTPLESAAELCRLSCCRHLDPNIPFTELPGVRTTRTFLHTLEHGGSKQELKHLLEDLHEHLWSCFLNSDLVNVSQYIQELRNAAQTYLDRGKCLTNVLDSLQRIHTKMQTQGALLARFPSTQLQRAAEERYGTDWSSYSEQQLEYSAHHYAKTRTLLSLLKSESAPSLTDAYRVLMESRHDTAYSRFRTPDRDRLSDTAMEGQYARFRTLAASISERGQEEYQITYQRADGTSIPLTTVVHTAAMPRWIHTDARYLNELLGELEKQWQEILASRDPQSAKDKIRDFYTLGVHACLTPRGTALYMLQLRMVLLEYHGLAATPPTRQALFPDCIALTLPLDTFKNRYDQCFEGYTDPYFGGVLPEMRKSK